ncbi:sugar transferase [Granulicella cerasi]|uniref:Sugar transferase n=1 Tax=Granulicella cerasi TaxID=741063 RepID=A0ABW1ZB40_9BACT|nr:sugar transferase [Granulicella cerasi]
MSAETQEIQTERTSVLSSPTGFATEATWNAYSTPRPRVASPTRRFSYRVVKRAFDVLAVLAVSPILVPLFAVIALAVQLSSPGPVFFSHRRIRSHGDFFSMWKFRTMCVNSAEVLEEYLAKHPEARAEWRETHKLTKDPRVTRVGNFLRRTSLDELPQLWNVLTGSMSLVGPRPIVAAEVEKYGDEFAAYAAVKPGVTGLWQVSGRSNTSYDERVKYDRQYAQEWSLRMDLMILVRTVTSVWHGDGAY